ncbi:MAG: hydrogenase expression/formation C-terminal domain-containing protein [Thiotrichales bacterium]
MSGLTDIPIRLEIGEPSNTEPSGLIHALAQEIIDALASHAQRADNHLIDLRGLPLGQHDLDALQALLGIGEVRATLDISGPSEIWETAYAGVWWVRHRAREDNVIAEYLEVGAIPSILRSHPDDMRDAAVRLAAQLNEANLSVTTRS